MEREWKNVKIIQDFFQIQEDGSIPEGSRVLLVATQPVTSQKGQEFVTIGAEPDDGMHTILDGIIQTFLVGDEPVGKQGPGEVIGELALVEEGTRKAMVWAVAEVSCANILKEVSEEIAHSNPKVYGAFLELLYTKPTNVIWERERMKSELEIVSKIQMGMLSKSSERYCRLPNISFDARTKPAKMAGGDLYDIL